ncbi:hypothetical protein KKA69_01240 [Patescibacteria group bacterium]|nr:hypothetical protein [Patescibacteria group bacterium]
MLTRNLIIVFGLIALILIMAFTVLKESEFPKEQKEGEISVEEKELIEAWILENNLNQYGDPKDTVYIGGTPLFNEMTGKSIDRYEYILRNYPDRPWKK